MKQLKKIGLIIVMAGVLFYGCSSGGGGGGDSGVGGGGSSPETPTSKISGSVRGTTIIAVNSNGDIVATDDTDGKTPNAQGNFPFTLSEIPVGTNVRVFLITGTGIYPMYFDSSNDKDPDTNVFSLGNETDINLGFVDTDSGVSKLKGWAIPQNDPTETAGVSSGTAVSDIPVGIRNAGTEGLTFVQLLDKGLKALKNGWIPGARIHLKKAVEAAGTSTSNDADTARFFYAFTRVAAVGEGRFSDGNSDDINQVGDFLDKIGCDPSDFSRSNIDAFENSCPEPDSLPENAPTGAEYQALLYNIIGQEIEGAVGNLDSISKSFNRLESWEGETFELDYGEVLAARAGMKGLLAMLAIQQAYDLDADIDAEQKKELNTTEKFLENNPNVFTLKDSSKLTQARKLFIESGNDLMSAIDSILAETDPQNDDLINLFGTPPAEIVAAKTRIAQVKDCLEGLECTIGDNGTPLDPADDGIVTINPFFGGLNLRDLLPAFAGNIPTIFPDPEMGGMILSGIDINKDTNFPPGVADILDNIAIRQRF